MSSMRLALAAIVVCAAMATALAQSPGVERLYVMECGQGRAPNQGRWSPGVNEGKPSTW